MKHLHTLALLAAVAVGATTVHASSFGLFTCASRCGNACSPCPRPYNAFSAFPCCATANAAGCTVFPPAGSHPSIASFGPGPGHWGGQQWYGFQKHWGHAYGYPYDLPLPYPCGALAAFTGTPGMGGCGDPYNGCGTKPYKECWLKHCFPGSDCQPPAGLIEKLKTHFGHNYVGGQVVTDGAIVESTTIAPPMAAAPAAPVYQPVSYQPTYYPAYYGGYYPTWGYYPMYGY